MNPLFAIDFYKADHRRQYPEGTSEVYSNFTPRSGKHSPIDVKGIVFFGLQAVIKKFLIEDWNKNFFQKPKDEIVSEYKTMMDTALGPNDIGTAHIEALHDLGYLPIHIKALPEGSYVPFGVPVLTIKNTHPDFFWITNYLESVLSAELWKMSTTATIALKYKSICRSMAAQTGVDFNPFQVHDFSFRGMSGLEDAAMTGMGHLTSWMGTDTVPAIASVNKYYETASFVGGSVPATEHSVMCMGGEEGEIETFKRLLNLYPTGIVSIVSDTWDFWKVVTEYLPTLKEKIEARDGKVVIRPDSGDPGDIICGTVGKLEEFSSATKEEFLKDAEEYLDDKIRFLTPHGEYGGDITEDVLWQDKIYTVTYSPDWNRHDKKYYYIDNYGDKTPTIDRVRDLTPEDKGAIECLWDTFGGTVNVAGYKILNPKIGLIYGDSITPTVAQNILDRLMKKGFASTNVVFGAGSFTYQHLTRDTFGFAMKATSGVVNGVRRDIQKSPKTDSGVKKSAKGLLRVEYERGVHTLYDSQTEDEELTGELYTVFKDGELHSEYTFDEIRDNINQI